MIFLKVIALGVSFSDAWALLIIFVAIQAEKVIDYLFPKRVDVFKELEEMKSNLKEVRDRSEDLERDVTALKFAGRNK